MAVVCTVLNDTKKDFRKIFMNIFMSLKSVIGTSHINLNEFSPVSMFIYSRCVDDAPRIWQMFTDFS